MTGSSHYGFGQYLVDRTNVEQTKKKTFYMFFVFFCESNKICKNEIISKHF